VLVRTRRSRMSRLAVRPIARAPPATKTPPAGYGPAMDFTSSEPPQRKPGPLSSKPEATRTLRAWPLPGSHRGAGWKRLQTDVPTGRFNPFPFESVPPGGGGASRPPLLWLESERHCVHALDGQSIERTASSRADAGGAELDGRAQRGNRGPSHPVGDEPLARPFNNVRALKASLQRRRANREGRPGLGAIDLPGVQGFFQRT